MKSILCAFSIVLLAGCSDSFIKHDLKFEKIGDCSIQKAPVKMVSNINGERYEFLECLEDGFDGKNYSVTRQGDSLIVDFPVNTSAKLAAFKISLDIDAKPAYHHIILGTNGHVSVVPMQ